MGNTWSGRAVPGASYEVLQMSYCVHHKNQGGTHCRHSGLPLKNLPMPKTSSVDMAIKAASELTHALQHPAPSSPFHKFDDSTLAALDKLATIFEKAVATEPKRVNKKAAINQEPISP